jgi:hypothetical protein
MVSLAVVDDLLSSKKQIKDIKKQQTRIQNLNYLRPLTEEVDGGLR